MPSSPALSCTILLEGTVCSCRAGWQHPLRCSAFPKMLLFLLKVCLEAIRCLIPPGLTSAVQRTNTERVPGQGDSSACPR